MRVLFLPNFVFFELLLIPFQRTQLRHLLVLVLHDPYGLRVTLPEERGVFDNEAHWYFIVHCANLMHFHIRGLDQHFLLNHILSD